MIKLKYSFFVFLFFCFLNTKAQINLVPNPSFEDTVGNNCWIQMLLPNPLISTNYVKNWYSSSNFGSPDYMNVCANSYTSAGGWPSTVPLSRNGYQKPKTGNAYIGMGTWVINYPTDSNAIMVEYSTVELKQKLKANTCYYGEFYASYADYCEIGINQLSMLLTVNNFTTASYSFTNTIQPQIQWDTTKYFTDTLNWVKISGIFIAQGGEQYLTFGNFKDGIHTKKTGLVSNFISPESFPGTRKFSFVFIDDVALYELPTPQLGATNYTICNNSDSLVLGDTARWQTTYQWFANGLPISTSNTIIVKPTQTTNYVLQSTQCGVTNQTITVTYSTNCEPVVVTEPIIPNVFTPNNDNVNDTFIFELNNSNLKSFTIYDRWGIEMYAFPSRASGNVYIKWDGRTTSGIECTAGVYFYVLEYTDVNGDTHKKNGYVTLIK